MIRKFPPCCVHAGSSPYFCVFFLIAFIVSCGSERPVDFAVYGNGAQARAYGKAAAGGILDFKNPKKFEYNYLPGPDAAASSLASLELEYSFSSPPSAEIKSSYQLVFESEGESWLLPMDFEFAGIDQRDTHNAVFHYAIPVRHYSSRQQFSITLLSPETQEKNADQLPAFQIRSLELKERWYGFFSTRSAGNAHFFASPFVYARANSQLSYVIDPPLKFLPDSGFPVQQAALSLERDPGARISLSYADGSLEALPGSAALSVSGAFFQNAPFPLELTGALSGFELRFAEPPAFPQPVPADPGLVLSWPEENWRDRRYEVFRWDRFPSLLIFDTADYAAQDRLFKRLAFFVEKAGFRGRLASDAEIAELHGWNAHDYRADDLAAFFEAARISNFPLLREERELQAILLGQGIIRSGSGGAISGGSGGVISISRESQDYLRSQFMAHEGFHGLFFIDEDFRAFSRERWLTLPRQDRRFITSYFDFQRYDIADEYLLINEFMAHILQQPAHRAAAYFGETLPRRLESSPWRRPALGEKDEASDSWPALAAAFTREAQAFSGYVNTRWGLSGGRVWLVVR